jgi:hypothetical protein
VKFRGVRDELVERQQDEVGRLCMKTGRMPFMAAPADTPIMASSDSGVSNTRRDRTGAQASVVPNIAEGSSTPWPSTKTLGSWSQRDRQRFVDRAAYDTTRPRSDRAIVDQ